MKKALAMIALAAICFGTTASAYTTMKRDTVKTKIKAKHNKVKIKRKKKDSTATS